jgi:hypothetical protein
VFNFFKQLQQLRMPRARPFQEMGVTGTVVRGGQVQTPERNPKWVGQSKYRTIADMMTNTSIIAASVHYFLNLISHPKWSVRPSDENDAEAVMIAEYVQEVIENMETPWPRIVRRMGTHRFYGFSIQEWTAKRRPDGAIAFKDIESRPQYSIEKWELDDDGSILGVYQRNPKTSELLPIPRKKFVYTVEDTLTDSPEGLGIFRYLAEPFERLRVFYALETKTFERDLRGIPIGRAPLSIINQAVKKGVLSQEEAKKMIEGMERFIQIEIKKSDTGMLLDSMPYESQSADGRKVSGLPQWGVELLTGPANGLVELSSAIERTQWEMARLLGTEAIMLGADQGSRALSADKSRNMYLIANSVLGSIVASVDKDTIDRIMELNNFPEDKRPWFSAEDVSFRDVQEVTSSLRDMATAGAVLAPDDPVINDVRDMLGVSRAELDVPLIPEIRDEPEPEPELDEEEEEIDNTEMNDEEEEE